MRQLPPLILAILLLSACQAERTEEHPGFIGNWSGRVDNCSYRIEVEDDNSAIYRSQCTSSLERKGGFKVVAEGTQVRIGGKRLEIVEYPYETIVTDTGSFWEMNLENVPYSTFK